MEALERAQEELEQQSAAAAAQLRAAEAAAVQAAGEKAQLQLSLDACSRELTEAAALGETLLRQLEAERAERREEGERMQRLLQEAQVGWVALAWWRQSSLVKMGLSFSCHVQLPPLCSGQSINSLNGAGHTPTMSRPMQGALEQERCEHAQLAASLQAMASGLQSSGDAEGQLRSQMIQLAEKVAVLTAAQVRSRCRGCLNRRTATALLPDPEMEHGHASVLMPHMPARLPPHFDV